MEIQLKENIDAIKKGNLNSFTSTCTLKLEYNSYHGRLFLEGWLTQLQLLTQNETCSFPGEHCFLKKN